MSQTKTFTAKTTNSPKNVFYLGHAWHNEFPDGTPWTRLCFDNTVEVAGEKYELEGVAFKMKDGTVVELPPGASIQLRQNNKREGTHEDGRPIKDADLRASIELAIE